MKDCNYFIGDLFHNSPVGILFYNEDGVFICANPSALKIAEIYSLNITKHNLFDDPNITPKKEILLDEGIIRFQAPLSIENLDDCPLPTKDGVSFFDWTIFIIDCGFLVQIQDITEFKKAEKSLKESEEKYRSWFADDLTGDFIATKDGEIIECNPAFIEIYGFNAYSKAIGSFISKFNQNDWDDMIKHLKENFKIQGFQSWHIRPDDEKIHVVANVVGIFNDLDELVRVKGYVFDDTERKIAEESLKESEKKYHRLFDEDLTGDFIASLDGKIIECNPSFAEIYGFSDLEMAFKWNISQSNPFDWPYIITRLKKERKIQGFQSWQRRSDGLRIHVVANVVGIFNDLDELVRVKGYVFDDTERKNAEDELSRSKSQISEILDSIQDCFIALNIHWDFVYVNQFAAEYFGMESDDIVGQNIWDIFPEFKKTTYETVFRNAMKTQEIQHFEAQDINSSEKLFDISVYPSKDGISIYWRHTMRK